MMAQSSGLKGLRDLLYTLQQVSYTIKLLKIRTFEKLFNYPKIGTVFVYCFTRVRVQTM